MINNTMAKPEYKDKYTFMCEWYDEEASKLRDLCLRFYPYDNTIELYDMNRNQMFVRRTKYPTLKLENLQLGATVELFSRLIYINSCAADTEKKLFGSLQSTFALIKPVDPELYGKIMSEIMRRGFRIVQLKLTRIDKDFSQDLYADHTNTSDSPLLIDHITRGQIIGMELVAPNAVGEWLRHIGVAEPSQAQPGTLRQMFGLDKIKNAVHGTLTAEHARKMINQFFGRNGKVLKIPMYARYESCTCCVVKPHAIKEHNLGAILECITSADFQITAMAMFLVDSVNAEEFHEVYDGVVSQFKDMALQLCSGHCVALEVISKKPDVNVVTEFRKLCGPQDPDVCRQLYPDSIRAQFGRDLVRNAVHCTDLPEDGILEVEYFFKLLCTQ